MNKLLKDAIADAKTVRETALANAKAVLEEAFAPKLQSMLSHKIKEEMETEEEGEEVSDEDKLAVAEMQKKAGITSDEDEDVMEIDSDEEEMEMNSEEEEEMDSEEEMEMNSDEEDVDSDEELEEILRELDSEEEDVVEMDSEEEEMSEGMHSNKEEEEEIDLEEIIKALREEGVKKKSSKKSNELMEGMIEFCGDPSNKGDAGWEMCESVQVQEGMIEFCGDPSNKGSDMYQYCEGVEKQDDHEEEKEAAAQEIEEAYRVIKFLRSKINEVNLLNAKLLFVNKLFRKGELTETQKVKIIETFDRAKNVHEAKLIYATLAESVTRKSAKPAIKRKMNEGYASAPQKKTQIISESNNVYNRFKSLVEYNQHNQ